jgi:hypothetical protein
MQNIDLDLRETGQGAPKPRKLAIHDLVIAGWTGRDLAAVEHHIAELAAIGVPRPPSVPCYYRVSAQLLTTADEIQVPGGTSSGEAECVLLAAEGGMLLAIGSDHTDRKVETYNIVVSKQMCPKPLSRDVWRYADVAGHWDQLVLRSWITEAGKRTLYQEGSVTALRPPAELIAKGFNGAAALPAGYAMFCGTLGAKGGVRPGAAFDLELHDPVRNLSLKHGYAVTALPMA